MDKRLIRLTESDLRKIVKESVNKVIKESYNASKYIVVYNGIPYPVNSIEEAANNLFGFRVEVSENGRDWDIIVNGESRAHYLRAGIDDNRGISSMDNGYTKEEALRDYMRNFVGKNTYSNLHWYQLVENSK